MKIEQNKLVNRFSEFNLRYVPVVCLIIYFAVVNQLSIFTEETKLYILIGMILVSLVAGIILAKKKAFKFSSYILFGLAIAATIAIYLFR